MRKPRRRRRGKRWKPRRYRLRALCYRRFRYRLNLFPLRNAAAAAAVAAETSEAAAIGGGAVETARAAAIAAAPPVIAAAGTSEAAANDSAKVRQPGRRRSVTPIVVGLGSFFDRGTVLLVIARECCLLPSLIRMMHWEMPLTSSRCTRRRVEKTGELVRRRDGELYVDAYGRMRRFHNE